MCFCLARVIVIGTRAYLKQPIYTCHLGVSTPTPSKHVVCLLTFTSYSNDVKIGELAFWLFRNLRHV